MCLLSAVNPTPGGCDPGRWVPAAVGSSETLAGGAAFRPLKYDPENYFRQTVNILPV